MAETINNWSTYWMNEKFEVKGCNTLESISWKGFLEDETVKNLDHIEIKLEDDQQFIYEIDKREFENYNELNGNLDGINWKNILKPYTVSHRLNCSHDEILEEFDSDNVVHSRTYNISYKLTNFSYKQSNLEDHIYEFITKNNELSDEGHIILKKRGHSEHCEGRQYFTFKTKRILELGFGIETLNDLNAFQLENGMNKVNGIMNIFKNKTKEILSDNYFENRELEKHFQMCFLLLLDQFSGIFYWEGKKICKRLHSLIESSNTTREIDDDFEDNYAIKIAELKYMRHGYTTGHIDVYFEDDYGINIVELKYMEPGYSQEDIKKVKIMAINQLCSYKLDDHDQPNLFLIIFKFNQNAKKFEYELIEHLTTYNNKIFNGINKIETKDNWSTYWMNQRIEVKGCNTLESISWKGFLEDETVKNLDHIEIKLEDDQQFIYEIDKREFENYNELNGNLDGINWKNILKPCTVSQRLNCSHDEDCWEKHSRQEYDSTFVIRYYRQYIRPLPCTQSSLEDYIYEFINETIKHGEIVLKFYGGTQWCESQKCFTKTIAIILKFGFGIETLNDLNAFRIENGINKVNGIMNIFKNKTKEISCNEYMYRNIIKFRKFFWEKHFQLCFLLLLDKCLSILNWEGGKKCERLHTLILNKNATGRIDVFFEDEYGINIVEFNYMRPGYSQKDLKKIKTIAIDQLCSYKFDDDVQPNLFLIIFKFNQNAKKFESELIDNLESYNTKI